MKRSAILFAPALLLAACQEEGINPENPWTDDVQETISHEMIELGEQLEDPYSIVNMTEALQTLYPTKAGRRVLSPTDLYVRFLPLNQGQYDHLEDLGVAMLDHPMDYKIVKEGDYYQDPEIPDGDITWQYAVVPKDFDFPYSITHELLDSVYIAEHDTQTKADGVDWAEVEREAFRLTGNEDMLVPATKGGSDTPSGRITITDDAFPDKVIGVKGVMVSCNVFVKFANAYTDEDGYYEMSRSFSSEPRYRLVFKNRKGFGIGFNLLLIPASISTLGKHSAEGVSVHVDSDSERKLFSRCVVNNAGYDYWESCSQDGVSIKTPPSNLRIWLFQHMDSSSAVMLQQGALIDNSLIGDFLGEYASLVKTFLPDITLGLDEKNTYASIYSVAQHEMAHASHFMQVGTSYWDAYIKFIITSFVTSGFVAYGVGTEEDHGYCEVGEMWAYYVESMLYRERYGIERTFGSSWWFSPEIFVNLDNRGINRFKIFQALTSDIHDRDMLQDKLVALYPECKSVINQAFGRYI